MILAKDKSMRNAILCSQSSILDPTIPRSARKWKCKQCGASVSVILSRDDKLPPKLNVHEVRGKFASARPAPRGSRKRRDYTGR
jgi:hypothetical protein